MSFWTWLRQPSTITGIGTLVGTITGTAAQSATGSTGIAAGAGATAFALTHLLINDNTAASDAQSLVTTGVQAATGGVPALVTDAPTLVTELFSFVRDIVGVPKGSAVTGGVDVSTAPAKPAS